MKIEENAGIPVRPHWTEHLERMRDQLAGCPRVLVASDFDGTLAEIVDRPADAELVTGAREALEKWTEERPGSRLSFLSGRSLEDLSTRLGQLSGKAILAGNHGLELRGGGLDWIHPVVALTRRHLDEIRARIRRDLGSLPGMELEDKGASLTVHHRRMAKKDHPRLFSCLETLELPDELRIHQGKMVHEIRPRVVWNKGYAIREIARHLEIPYSATVFLGDDVTDEDAFRELGPEAITVHVGAETAVSAARFNADGPADVVRFLETLLGRAVT